MSEPAPDPLSAVRDDVRVLRAYPVPSAEGMVKLDMMENP
ncbi:MAG TPA: histidinol-phosphate aminotransferase, partial [Burkholderiaceae bacterium]|nr:histidinol-phosphate aminotransferase [Burkholderiaceae bacterium]